MNHIHLPRPLVNSLFILVVASFFVGTFRAFTPARAVSNATFTPTSTLVLITASFTPVEPENETLGSTPAFITTAPAGSNGSHPPNPTLAPAPESSADMTGIIALGILMVFVILVGMVWGGRSSYRKK